MARHSTAAPSAAPAGVEGTSTVTTGSQAGYRVAEVLNGQSATAVGRTTAVTGSLTIAGTTVPGGSFTVDLTRVASDQSRRDGQFQGRIMQTSTFPTGTFELTQALDFGSVPADGGKVSAVPPRWAPTARWSSSSSSLAPDDRGAQVVGGRRRERQRAGGT